ncbi:MAG: fatty acid desaturase [Acidimicrobiia bacterium]
MTATMVPSADLLVPPDPTAPISANGKPKPELREELRRIPDVRNALNIAVLYALTVGIFVAAVQLDDVAVWIVAFLVMGPVHARFAILMHEAAHRLLFSNRKVNDFVGKWLVAFPAFVPIDLYRRGHMAHHREEFGPNEPDIPLYRNYPIPRDSMLRKLRRDALGITGWKLTKGLFRGVASDNEKVRGQARGIVAAQLVILGVCAITGHPWVYFILWFLPHLTVWRLMNRLRGIAEHGGLKQSADRRETTHSVRQHWPARLTIVPYFTGWHLAHHVDSGIPMRNLPRLHEELVRSGYVQPELEYRSYPALWRALASG